MTIVYLILAALIISNTYLMNLSVGLLKRIKSLEESQSSHGNPGAEETQWIPDRLNSHEERISKSEDSLNKLWKALRASTNRKPQANRKKPTDK